VNNVHHTTLLIDRLHMLVLIVLIGDTLLILLPITCVTTVVCLLVTERFEIY